MGGNIETRQVPCSKLTLQLFGWRDTRRKAEAEAVDAELPESLVDHKDDIEEALNKVLDDELSGYGSASWDESSAECESVTSYEVKGPDGPWRTIIVMGLSVGGADQGSGGGSDFDKEVLLSDLLGGLTPAKSASKQG
jgi:hypothetical protein